MEAIIFCGIQATGKSTFYKQNFFNSYLRISMDLLKTRYRENRLLEYCLDTSMPFVIDNTNPSKRDRLKYIEQAKKRKYKIIGYYFQSKIEGALSRNAVREGRERIPDVGIKGTFNTLELPSFDEGFDELYYVIMQNGEFEVMSWDNEI